MRSTRRKGSDRRKKADRKFKRRVDVLKSDCNLNLLYLKNQGSTVDEWRSRSADQTGPAACLRHCEKRQWIGGPRAVDQR